MYYAKSHEYVSIDGSTGTVGITDHAQNQLGDVVYVELPEVGDEFEAAEGFGSVESVKAASDVYLPVDGTVSAINETLEDSPGLVNEDAYGEGWFVKIDITGDVDALLASGDLMDEAAYETFCAEEE